MAQQAEIAAFLADRESLLDASSEPLLSLRRIYRDGEHIPDHCHRRSQLLHALTGVVTVTTQQGRWMVPPEHALWIPAGTVHSVDILGDVRMYSNYVRPGALPNLPVDLHVAGLTPLMRALIAAACALCAEDAGTARSGAIAACLLHEIPKLPRRPLGVSFPAHPKLAAQCRAFLAAPGTYGDIDAWASAASMSRRTFTRFFRRETGLSLSTWRQQACLMAALPRLSAGEPVTRIALDLGYDSVPAFTTMFKRMLGRPPHAYLRSLSRP